MWLVDTSLDQINESRQSSFRFNWLHHSQSSAVVCDVTERASIDSCLSMETRCGDSPGSLRSWTISSWMWDSLSFPSWPWNSFLFCHHNNHFISCDLGQSMAFCNHVFPLNEGKGCIFPLLNAAVMVEVFLAVERPDQLRGDVPEVTLWSNLLWYNVGWERLSSVMLHFVNTDSFPTQFWPRLIVK